MADDETRTEAQQADLGAESPETTLPSDAALADGTLGAEGTSGVSGAEEPAPEPISTAPDAPAAAEPEDGTEPAEPTSTAPDAPAASGPEDETKPEGEAPAASPEAPTPEAGAQPASDVGASPLNAPVGGYDTVLSSDGLPSGGDGSQGTALPAAPTEGVQGSSSADAEAPTDADADSDALTTPTDAAEGAEEKAGGVGSEQAEASLDEPGKDDEVEAEAEADKPVAAPTVLTSAMLSDGSIPQHGANDAPSTDPLQQATLFGGKSHPSPDPDVDPASILPHPALSDQSPGFISGTTQGTQSALPVPGPADAAASTAASLSGTGNTAAGDLADPAINAGAAGADAAKDAGDAAEKASDEALDGAGGAGDAPDIDGPFQTASDDGKAIAEALGKVTDDIADVIVLELKSLGNLAARLQGRLDKGKGELEEPEQRTQLLTVANKVAELLGSLSGLFDESAGEG